MSETKHKKKISLPTTYQFGGKPAALIAVKLSSDGKIEVFARRRPVGVWDEMNVPIFSAKAQVIAPDASVTFAFELRRLNPAVPPAKPTDKRGILTVEAATWQRPYDINVVHMLGYLAPFGDDEIPYGSGRPTDVDSNRKFTCTFTGKGILTFVDGTGNSATTVNIATLDQVDLATGAVLTPGGVFVAVRVTEENYDDGCVTLDFSPDTSFEVSYDTYVLPRVTRFCLNATTNHP